MAVGFFTNPTKLVIKEKIEYNDLVNLLHGEAKLCLDKDKHASASGNSAATSKDGLELTSAQGDRGNPNDPHVRLKRDSLVSWLPSNLRILLIASSLWQTHIFTDLKYWTFHLLARDPEWADVKLAQAKYLLSRLAQFKMLVSDKFQCVPSVILAGDFNSVPGDKVTHMQRLEPNGNFCTVYAYTREEPEFTNCTPDFTNTLDYIFFTPSGDLKPVSYLELPERESSDVRGGLPNYHHPSDHLPIGAEFEADDYGISFGQKEHTHRQEYALSVDPVPISDTN
ncbi:hypothetical protein RJ639_019798 [Escallonia herrerae]|uniref:Endonuclease/exonuclease/phosphatase domain-containing protein n=1 Tax=Escallonia herrerae TaxID=1293975 RepID=A0AA89AHV3_9ASTE|nr:hypothetical protein RJ639_019798 [Escallonia herrerae]